MSTKGISEINCLHSYNEIQCRPQKGSRRLLCTDMDSISPKYVKKNKRFRKVNEANIFYKIDMHFLAYVLTNISKDMWQRFHYARHHIHTL